MDIVLWIVGVILLGSLVFTALVIREFYRVTKKRRAFIAALGGSGRAVPFFRDTLVMMYIISSVAWVVGLIWYFFSIIE